MEISAQPLLRHPFSFTNVKDLRYVNCTFLSSACLLSGGFFSN